MELQEMADQTTLTATFLTELDAFLHADEYEVAHEQKKEDIDDIESPLSITDSFMPLFDPHEWAEMVASSAASSAETQSPTEKTTAKRKPVIEAEVARAKEARRRQMYRQRAKNERDSLRQEVTQLSDHLIQLTQAAKKRKKNHECVNVVDSTSTWKVLALCNRNELLQAEAENNRLIAAVRSQKLVIAQLGSVIRKNLKRGLPVQLNEVCSREKRKDMELYKAYLAELNSNYAQADRVFTTQGIASMREGVVKSVVKDSNDGSVKFFQYRRKGVFSLHFDHASQSLWDLTHLDYQQQDRQVYQLSNSEDSYAVKFRHTREQKDGSPVSILHRHVLRRFVNAECVVLVWKAFIEGEDAFHGMNSNESGWIRLRPSETGSEMEMYVNQVPMYFSSAQMCEADVAQFLEVVLGVGQESEEHVLHGLASLSLSNSPISGGNRKEESSNLNALTKRLSTRQFSEEKC